MSDFDRSKYGKKKYLSSREVSFGRCFATNKGASGSGLNKLEEPPTESNKGEVKVKQPTILIKAREQPEEVGSSPKRMVKEANEASGISGVNEGPVHKPMHKSMKFIEEGVLCSESVHDYFQDNNDFLVIGIIGGHGVGKSTLLNFLAHNKITTKQKEAIFKHVIFNDDTSFADFIGQLSLVKENDNINHEIFKVQSQEDIENIRNCTNGIDMFITENRIILLDCQPIMSVSIIDDLVENENKRPSLVNEFMPSENSGEIQALQLTTFLMSVCHVLLVVQDWIFDSNIIRFVQTAEMLKPTIAAAEDDLTDHFPHLILVHNKAQVDDFSPMRFEVIQQIYRTLFNKSKLFYETNIGIGTGRIVKYLNPQTCGTPINIFLISEFDPSHAFEGHPSFEELISRLRANILGATKHPLTHVQLTEKTWLLYCCKVWENVKKSSFFVEYTKLMP